jgi:ATP-dependent RNA helicase UAP56/SUB2
LCTKLSAMDEPYPEMEELLYYEEEEEAAPDIVAAKTNGKTVKK